MEDEHLRARGFWETVSHAEAGTWDMEGPVWRMSRTPAHVRLPAADVRRAQRLGAARAARSSATDEIAALDTEGVTAREPNLGVHGVETSGASTCYCGRRSTSCELTSRVFVGGVHD